MAPEGAALARALTGEHLEVAAADPAGVVAALAELGWDARRLADLRAERMRRREPWPFPVDRALLAGIGFARFAVLLSEIRTLLGLAGQVAVGPAAGRPLNRDELRLAAERPPHWG